MGKLGGARPGAGRKPGTATIEKEKARQYIADHIAKYMPVIFSVLIQKASEGDISAIKELFDRGFGRATQMVDVTTKGEQINSSQITPEVAEALKKFEEELKNKIANDGRRAVGQPVISLGIHAVSGDQDGDRG